MILVCHFSSIYLYLRTKSLYASQRQQLTSDPDAADASLTNAATNPNAAAITNAIANAAPVYNSAPDSPDTNPLIALIHYSWGPCNRWLKGAAEGSIDPGPATVVDATAEAVDVTVEAPETCPPSSGSPAGWKTWLKSSFGNIAANIAGPPEWLTKTATSLIVFCFVIGLLGFLLSLCEWR